MTGKRRSERPIGLRDGGCGSHGPKPHLHDDLFGSAQQPDLQPDLHTFLLPSRSQAKRGRPRLVGGLVIGDAALRRLVPQALAGFAVWPWLQSPDTDPSKTRKAERARCDWREVDHSAAHEGSAIRDAACDRLPADRHPQARTKGMASVSAGHRAGVEGLTAGGSATFVRVRIN